MITITDRNKVQLAIKGLSSQENNIKELLNYLKKRHADVYNKTTQFARGAMFNPADYADVAKQYYGMESELQSLISLFEEALKQQ